MASGRLYDSIRGDARRAQQPNAQRVLRLLYGGRIGGLSNAADEGQHRSARWGRTCGLWETVGPLLGRLRGQIPDERLAKALLGACAIHQWTSAWAMGDMHMHQGPSIVSSESQQQQSTLENPSKR